MRRVSGSTHLSTQPPTNHPHPTTHVRPTSHTRLAPCFLKNHKSFGRTHGERTLPVVFRERIPSKPGGARPRTIPDRCLILVVAAWPLLDFDAQAFSWLLARRDHVAARKHPRQCACCMPASAPAGHRPAVEIEVVCLPFLVASSLTQTRLRYRSGHACRWPI